MNLNIPDETNIVTNADENYGTFQENIVQINENDDWNDNFIFLLFSLISSFCYVLWGSQEVRKFQADSTSSRAGSPWCYQPETS